MVCVVTEQGLGAASKPYHCLSIRAFIAAPRPSGATRASAVSRQNFCKYHAIYARVQPCILFWGWVVWVFFVIGCWQI